jgi:hypothetical protein
MTVPQEPAHGDDLVARARKRAETSSTPSEFGYRVVLRELDHFVGRWRGETTDPDSEGRRIYLLWDEGGNPCFSRDYVSLGREVDRVRPEPGDLVVIARGSDYLSQQGRRGFRFVLEKQSCDESLGATAPWAAADVSDGIPY